MTNIPIYEGIDVRLQRSLEFEVDQGAGAGVAIPTRDLVTN